MIVPPHCALPFVTCVVNGRAAPLDIRRWTDGTARHGTLVIMYIDTRVYDIRNFLRSPETDLDPILLVVEHLHASHVVEHGIVVVVHHIVRHHGRKVRALGGGGWERT